MFLTKTFSFTGHEKFGSGSERIRQKARFSPGFSGSGSTLQSLTKLLYLAGGGIPRSPPRKRCGPLWRAAYWREGNFFPAFLGTLSINDR